MNKIECKFKVGERVIYPSHGLGIITDVTQQSILDMTIDVYVISFVEEKMSVIVPVHKATSLGLRKIASKKDINEVYRILSTKPKRGNKMWSRRAQEYESKIYSGDLSLTAEVVRDLYKNAGNDRSYSERKIFEIALSRITTEISIVTKSSMENTTDKLVQLLKDKLVSKDSVFA